MRTLLFLFFFASYLEAKQLYRLATTNPKAVLQTLNAAHLDIAEILSHKEEENLHHILVHASSSFIRKLTPLAQIEAMNLEQVVRKERRLIDECQSNVVKDWDLADRSRNSMFSQSNFFQCFWQEHDIFAFLDHMTTTSTYLTKFDISQTLEGRTIPAFLISQDNTGVSDKPLIYIQGMLHAREYISPPTVIFTMESLIDAIDNQDQQVLSLLEKVNFVFVPLVNIDGYIYTWSTNRMWRKNKRVTNGQVHGVDLNRNYGPPERHCGWGSSTNLWSQTYCGSHAFSEPEIQHIDAWMLNHTNIIGSIDVHSYAASVYCPSGANEYSGLAKGMANAINTVHTDFPYGTRMTTTYGTFKDNQYASYFQRPSFTLELRGSGFDVNPLHIRRSGEENFYGFLYFAETLASSTRT